VDHANSRSRRRVSRARDRRHRRRGDAGAGRRGETPPLHRKCDHPIAKIECFDSFTVAVSKATGGRINDAPEDAGKAAYDAAFEAKLKALAKLAGQPGVQAQNVIEIDYDYHFFGTDTFTWWVENGGCETNPLGRVKYWVWNLDDYGWNDRINAFGNDHLCYSQHFEHAGFQGLAIGWDYGWRGGLGPLDGEISSIQWS
jgi:hypothetical protein